ncbi:MAG: alpha/beta hydrolase [Polaromonas sp.]|uniref:alpha/beta fold hydrolase n=1 Tax=Polaromonas sp. TaxID=1869339 RepID=UPI0025D6C4C2|nr:alpha/beta hydrolase [Polaromonas sp.]MBI2726501.1 alpha/beta hydrolase [Polaromonas sp.]
MSKRVVKANTDGEKQQLGNVTVTHHFVEAPGAVIPIRWHYVEAGKKDAETIVFLHGNPESWYAWRPQIEHFSSNFHIIAPDHKGYGQGDKRPGDWRWENCAEEMLALFDKIGLKRFHIVAHDRGCVLADYLSGNHPERVMSYVRMQQVCHIWRAENSPQGTYFADPILGPNLFANPDYYFNYRLLKMLRNPVAPEVLEHLKDEMSHPGMPESVIRFYQASSFEKERLDRTSRLLRNMRFPVLLLQGDMDDGQPTYYYDDPVNPAVAQFPDARLEWVTGAGHYTNLEKPEVVTEKVEAFLKSITA